MHTIIQYAQKITTLFLLCTLALACGNDDDPIIPEPSTDELIIGKWYLIKQTEPDGSIDVPENDCERKTYYEFRTDGTLNTITYELEGDDCKGTVQEAKFSFTTDGKLVLSVEAYPATVIDILTLDKTKMELKNSSTRQFFLFEKR